MARVSLRAKVYDGEADKEQSISMDRLCKIHHLNYCRLNHCQSNWTLSVTVKKIYSMSNFTLL